MRCAGLGARAAARDGRTAVPSGPLAPRGWTEGRRAFPLCQPAPRGDRGAARGIFFGAGPPTPSPRGGDARPHALGHGLGRSLGTTHGRAKRFSTAQLAAWIQALGHGLGRSLGTTHERVSTAQLAAWIRGCAPHCQHPSAHATTSLGARRDFGLRPVNPTRFSASPSKTDAM